MAVADAGDDNFVANDVEDDDMGAIAMNPHGPVKFLAQPDCQWKITDEIQLAAQLLNVAPRLLLAEKPDALSKDAPQIFASCQGQAQVHWRGSARMPASN